MVNGGENGGGFGENHFTTGQEEGLLGDEGVAVVGQKKSREEDDPRVSQLQAEIKDKEEKIKALSIMLEKNKKIMAQYWREF